MIAEFIKVVRCTNHCYGMRRKKPGKFLIHNTIRPGKVLEKVAHILYHRSGKKTMLFPRYIANVLLRNLYEEIFKNN